LNHPILDILYPPFFADRGITISEHFGKVASNDAAMSLARAVVKGQRDSRPKGAKEKQGKS
jgi:hypothetical protein